MMPTVLNVRPDDVRLIPALRAAGRDPGALAFPPDSRAWLLHESEKTLGYAMIYAAPGLPGVYDLEGAILPAHRRQGLGRILLAAVLADLEGGPMRQLAASVPSTGIPAARFLLAQGFHVEHREWQMVMAEPSSLPDPVLPAGFEWRTYGRSATIPLFRRLYELAFAGLPWHQPYEEDRDVAAELGAADDLLYLCRGPEAVGFAWLRRSVQEEGQIEPMGMVAAYQGKGLGGVLLQGAIRRLAEMGVKQVSVGLWAENERAMRLYRRFGFHRQRAEVFLALDLNS